MMGRTARRVVRESGINAVRGGGGKDLGEEGEGREGERDIVSVLCALFLSLILFLVLSSDAH